MARRRSRRKSKSCKPGYRRHPKTKRCRKIKSHGKSRKKCKQGYVRSASGHCVKLFRSTAAGRYHKQKSYTYKGKKRSSRRRSRRKSRSKSRRKSRRKSKGKKSTTKSGRCRQGYYRHPTTKRCRSMKGLKKKLRKTSYKKKSPKRKKKMSKVAEMVKFWESKKGRGYGQVRVAGF